MGEDLSMQQLAQTGGYPVNKVIVIVEDGEPQTVAFLTDVDDAMLKLAFNVVGEMTVDTGPYPFITLDVDTMQLIQRLAIDGMDLAADLARCGQDFGHLITHPRPIDLHETLA